MSSLFLDLEITGYILGFWLFMLWKPFRDEWLQEFRAEDASGRAIKIFQAIVSILLGVVLPCFLVYWLLAR